MNPISTDTTPGTSGLRRIGMLCLLFFVGLCLAAFLGQVAASMFPDGSRPALLVQSAIQAIVAFLLPTWLTARLTSPDPWRFTEMSTPPAWRAIAGVFILFAISLPAMNQIIWWNSQMHLPASMSGMEATLRQWEEAGAGVSARILDCSSVGGMLVGVLVVGLLTGLGEESFFRGGLQRSLAAAGISRHVAIWSSAVIFSAVHFQFFGFFPRMLLGAMFGYLLYWTSSLWVSAAAHALNNSIVVVSWWLASRGMTTMKDPAAIGVAYDGFPVVAAASAVLTAAFLILARRFFFGPRQRRSERPCFIKAPDPIGRK
jgi:abortive infection protein